MNHLKPNTEKKCENMKKNSLNKHFTKNTILTLTSGVIAFTALIPQTARAVAVTSEDSSLQIEFEDDSEKGEFSVLKFVNPEIPDSDPDSEVDALNDDPIPRSRKSRLFLQSMANYQSGKRVSTKDFYAIDPKKNPSAQRKRDPFEEEAPIVNLGVGPHIRNDNFGKNNGFVFSLDTSGINTIRDPGSSKKIVTAHYNASLTEGPSMGAGKTKTQNGGSNLFRLFADGILDINTGEKTLVHLMLGPDFNANVTSNSRGRNDTNLHAYTGIGTGFRFSEGDRSLSLFGSIGKIAARNRFAIRETYHAEEGSPHETLPDNHKSEKGHSPQYVGMNAFSKGNAGRASLKYTAGGNFTANASWIAVPRKLNPETNTPIQIVDLVLLWNVSGVIGLNGSVNHVRIDTSNPSSVFNPVNYGYYWNDGISNGGPPSVSELPKWTKSKIEADMSHYSEKPIKIPDSLKTTTFTIGAIIIIGRD
jgi:hypothetical protein